MNSSQTSPQLPPLAEIQRLIEDLRYAAGRPEWTSPQQLGDLIATYAEICEIVNIRLRKLGNLLQRGLRVEAITLADEQPPLLPLVELLDFPELSQLELNLAQHQMILPPGLLLDIAQQLNSAYSENLGLASLLREHRLLALTRAPLNKRLNVLRNLANKDPHNLIWQDDQRVWEQERLRQLQTEIAAAAEAENLVQLQELQREVKGPGWLHKPGPELQHYTDRAFNKVAQAQARRALAALLPQMEEAQANWDYGFCQQLDQRWQEQTAYAQLEPHVELQQRYQQIADWMEQQRVEQETESQFQQEIYGLEQALERGADYLELTNRANRLSRYEREIPQTLLRRVSLRLDYLNVRSKRKTILWVASIATAVILCVGGIVWFTKNQMFANEVANAVAAANKMLNAGDVTGAGKFLEQLEASSPAVYAHTDLSAPRAKYAKLDGGEKQRLLALERSWKLLEAAGPDSPDKGALETARKSVKTEDEKTLLAEWEQRISAATNRQQAERDDQFRGKLDALRSAVEKTVANSDAADPQSFQSEVDTLSARLQSLRATPRISQDLLEQVVPLQTVLQKRLTAFQTVSKQYGELDLWANSVSIPENHARSLLEYAKRYPNTPRSLDAERVAEEVKFWQASQAWRKFLADSELYSGSLTPLAAAGYIKFGDSLLEQYGEHYYADSYRALQKHLQHVAQRLENGKPISDKLMETLRDQLFSELYVVETNKSVRYYLTKTSYDRNPPGLWKEGRVEDLDYLTNESLVKKKFSERISNIAFHGAAPHNGLCGSLLSQLSKLDNSNWFETHEKMLQSVDQVLKTEHRIDPIILAMLLKRVLKQGSLGSLAFEVKYADKMARLNSDDLDLSVNWLDPTDENVNNARVIAQKLIATGYSTAREATPPAAPVMRAFLIPQGFVHRDLRGEWQWRCNEARPIAARLFVLLQPNSMGPVQFAPVGSVVDKQLTWTDVSALREGRPIYLVVPAK